MTSSEKPESRIQPPVHLEDSWKDLQTTSTSDRESDSLILPMVKGLKVMILGDTQRRRQKLVAALRTHGVRASAATADQKGYRDALTFHPDVVITEMLRPGDPGWWIIKRFHRNPLLRWTPTLMMKWWVEKDGQETIQIKQVFERLMESLAPIRVIEERIAAGRKLHERVETTGVAPILRVLVNAQLTGNLTVNDSWNVFEVEMRRGETRSCIRRGVDNREDRGEEAFLQLMTVDSGHWNFRMRDPGPGLRNIRLSFDPLMAETSEKLRRLLGPDVRFSKSVTTLPIHLDQAICHELAATMNDVQRDLLEAIAAGISEQELDTIIGSDTNPVEVEHAIISLIRCGGIRITDNIGTQPSDDEVRRARRVFHVLEWLSRDHQMADPNLQEADIQRKDHPRTGYYQFANGATDHVNGVPGNVRPPHSDTRETVTLDENDDDVSESLRDSWNGESAEWRRTYASLPNASDSGRSNPLNKEAVDTGHLNGDQISVFKWVAIGIAILMSGLLIAGLVLISSV